MCMCVCVYVCVFLCMRVCIFRTCPNKFMRVHVCLSFCFPSMPSQFRASFVYVCNTLQHTATQRKLLQHSASHCNALQRTRCKHEVGRQTKHTATHCNTHCNTLRYTATNCSTCNTLQYTATNCNNCNTPQHTLHHTATCRNTRCAINTSVDKTHGSTLQHTATLGNIPQRTLQHMQRTLQHMQC